MQDFVTSVGMEVHAELLTESKMFCRCAVEFGGEPNTRTCPVCLGLPGALPVPNREAVRLTLMSALALGCQIPGRSVFHRKNYFYPDLPKGFQTSQYGETNPIGFHGELTFPMQNGTAKTVKIRRVHLEEDTGKLSHLGAEGSGIDYNRSGVPLMEIVTDFPPDITSADEAREYLVHLREILVWIGACDGKMEQGSLRCEPNISIRPKGSDIYGTKTEIKNLNSFRSVHLGVAFEAGRQADKIKSGQALLQETRGWNESTLATYPMRSKEDEQDYRYFECPDLMPMSFDEETINDVKAALPELPIAKRARYMAEFALAQEDAVRLTATRAWSEWFDNAVALGGDPKAICNWMNSDLAKLLNEREIQLAEAKVSPAALVELAKLIDEGTINGKTAKVLLREMLDTGASASKLVDEKGLKQIDDPRAVATAVAEAIAANPEQARQYAEGQDKLAGYFVGIVMKATGGRAKIELVNQELRKRLRP